VRDEFRELVLHRRRPHYAGLHSTLHNASPAGDALDLSHIQADLDIHSYRDRMRRRG